GEEKIGQGRDNVIAFLETKPELVAEFEEKLRKIMFPGREFPRGNRKAPGTGTAAAPPAEEPASVVPEPAAVPVTVMEPGTGAEVKPASGDPGVRPVSPEPAVPPPGGVKPPPAADAAGRVPPKPAAPHPSQPAPFRGGAERGANPKGGPVPAPRPVGRPRKNPDPAGGLF
ncbi:MAG: hypothetical protein LBH57_06760, partial [Treponema sp.]|nr:hypothetical protein [Treponema sp.]